MSDILGRILHYFRLAVQVFTGVMFVVMVGAVAVQVVSRNLNIPISRAADIAVFAQIWMVMFGAGLAMRAGQHIGIDILIRMCPLRVQQVVTVGALALSIWFLVMLIIAGLALIEISQFQTTSTGLPIIWAYAAIPLGSAYFALELAIALVPIILMRKLPGEERA